MTKINLRLNPEALHKPGLKIIEINHEQGCAMFNIPGSESDCTCESVDIGLITEKQYEDSIVSGQEQRRKA
ncbi:hypothetical protein G6732_06300 [Polynucleobacter paneuropaeus]|nr:hypothetical protein [Polynucleobacter paneuropaeus]